MDEKDKDLNELRRWCRLLTDRLRADWHDYADPPEGGGCYLCLWAVKTITKGPYYALLEWDEDEADWIFNEAMHWAEDHGEDPRVIYWMELLSPRDLLDVLETDI